MVTVLLIATLMMVLIVVQRVNEARRAEARVPVRVQERRRSRRR